MLAQIKCLLVAAQECWVERIDNGIILFRVIGNLLDCVEGKDTKEGKKKGGPY